MFYFGHNDNYSKNLIIDTLVQTCTSNVTFMGSDRNDLSLQKCMTFYSLKNCPDTSKRVFQLISDLIFAETQQKSLSSDIYIDDDTIDRMEEENEEEVDDEDIDLKIQQIINSSTVCFIDQPENQSYIVNFMKLHLGNIDTFYNVETAWWSLSRCPTNNIKLAIFVYTRSIPNFNIITAYVNAWKHLNRDTNNKNLICILLVSPVIYSSTKDALTNYRANFQWLLNMASSANCCEGLHCDKVLKQQYMIDSTCPNSMRFLDNLSVLELIMKIYEDIEAFIKSRENSQNPVFHEQDLVTNLKIYDRTIAEAITASFLYRGIPIIGKNGKPNVCIKLCKQNTLFVVKNDNQKYINLSTITGISFDNAINTILSALNEEYPILHKSKQTYQKLTFEMITS